MATVLSASLLGCGKGPKHLSEKDYGHGKTAFEALQRRAASPAQIDGNFADEQVKEISNLELRTALSVYSESISLSALWSTKTEFYQRRILRAMTETERHKWTDLLKEAEAAEKEEEKIIILCHDDAAAYFDAKAATTGTCQDRQEAFLKAHPLSNQQ